MKKLSDGISEAGLSLTFEELKAAEIGIRAALELDYVLGEMEYISAKRVAKGISMGIAEHIASGETFTDLLKQIQKEVHTYAWKKSGTL